MLKFSSSFFFFPPLPLPGLLKVVLPPLPLTVYFLILLRNGISTLETTREKNGDEIELISANESEITWKEKSYDDIITLRKLKSNGDATPKKHRRSTDDE